MYCRSSWIVIGENDNLLFAINLFLFNLDYYACFDTKVLDSDELRRKP